MNNGKQSKVIYTTNIHSKCKKYRQGPYNSNDEVKQLNIKWHVTAQVWIGTGMFHLNELHHCNAIL